MAKRINVIYKVDNKELQHTKTVLKDVEAETKKSEAQMTKLSKSAQKAGQDSSKSFLDFKNIIATISFAAIITGITALGKKIFELGAQQEQLNIAFTTFLGSAEKAKRLLADLTKFAIVTPFTTDQVTKAARTLLSFGTAAKDIIPTLKFLGDVSAGTGKDLAEMSVIFGQIQSTGRLMGQDLLQLINAGFNPLQQISQKTGRSVRDLKEDMEKGLITFDMVKQSFVDATSAGGLFFNLTERQSVSVLGQISNIAGNLDEAMKSIFASNTGLIKSFVDALSDASDGLRLFFETADQKQSRIDAAIIERFEASGLSIEKEIEIQQGRIKQRQDEIKGFLDEVARFGEAAGVTPDMITERQKEILVIQKELDVIQRLNKERQAEKTGGVVKSSGLSAEDAAKAAKEEEEQAKRLADRLLEIEKRAEDEEVRLKKESDASKEDLDKVRESNRKAAFDRWVADAKTANEAVDEAAQELFDNDKRRAEEKEEFERRAFNLGLDLITTLLVASMQSNQDEIATIQERYDKEAELAGNNEKTKKSIREREKIEIDKARKEQKKKDKENAIAKIGIETAVNIIRSISNNGGIPYGLPAGALAALAGLVQIAAVAGYKEGGWINGPGTETSDSVPIMASAGEFMVKASAAQQSPNLLEAINERRLSDNVLRSMTTNGGSKASAKDNEAVVRAIKDSRVDYDVHGFTLMKAHRQGDNFKRYIRSKVQGYR